VDSADAVRLVGILFRYTEALSGVAGRSLGARAVANQRIRILVEIHLDPGVTPGEVAQRLGMDRSVMSRHLTALVQDGLITRHRSSRDARVRQLMLTVKGAREIARFTEDLRAYFVEGAPYAKELLHLCNADPEAAAAQIARPPLLVAGALASAGVRVATAGDEALERLGLELDYHEKYALNFLCEVGETRPGPLASELGLSPQGTTELMERLERLDLIHRGPPPPGGDRRAVVVSLTTRGRSAAEATQSAIADHADHLAAAVGKTLAGSARPPEAPVA
jgi:DNA-binding MarR family transcriptional regulator